MAADLVRRIDKLFEQGRRGSASLEIADRLDRIEAEIAQVHEAVERNARLLAAMLQKDREIRKFRHEDYLRFVHRLRRYLRHRSRSGASIVITFELGVYGVDREGFIYERGGGRRVPADLAYDIFAFLYERRERLQEFIRIDTL